jgi:uncharacterized protein (TIGR03083 family)
MATFVDKRGIVGLLRNEFQELVGLGGTLHEAQWDTPTCLPGWSVRDVFSHMIGTEAALLGEPVPEVDTSHLTHMRNPIAEANEVWVEANRGLTGAQMVARMDDVTARRMAELEAMTQADFDAPSWTPAGKDETYGRFMRIRHFDCFLHEQDARLALGMPARDSAEDVTSSLDEVATGLGYIVGRKAGMPDGSRVRIDLTGPGARTFLVRVDGRAAVVDTLDGEPTVGIELPAMRFLRLTGGRHDGGTNSEDGVRLSGDHDLGVQLLANLAFTI